MRGPTTSFCLSDDDDIPSIGDTSRVGGSVVRFIFKFQRFCRVGMMLGRTVGI